MRPSAVYAHVSVRDVILEGPVCVLPLTLVLEMIVGSAVGEEADLSKRWIKGMWYVVR